MALRALMCRFLSIKRMLPEVTLPQADGMLYRTERQGFLCFRGKDLFHKGHTVDQLEETGKQVGKSMNRRNLLSRKGLAFHTKSKSIQAITTPAISSIVWVRGKLYPAMSHKIVKMEVNWAVFQAICFPIVHSF